MNGREYVIRFDAPADEWQRLHRYVEGRIKSGHYAPAPPIFRCYPLAAQEMPPPPEPPRSWWPWGGR